MPHSMLEIAFIDASITPKILSVSLRYAVEVLTYMLDQLPMYLSPLAKV
jgi:hypothetical protein